MARTHTRRAVLAGAGLAALSGCLGYQIERSENVASRKQRIENLEERNDDLQDDLNRVRNDLTDTEDRVEELDAEIRELERENQDVTDELESARERRAEIIETQLRDLYVEGHTFYTTANGEWSNARASYSDQDYENGLSLFSSALGHYDGARELFNLAGSLAEEHGYETARETALDANLYCAEYRDAADHMASACFYYLNGNDSRGDGYVEDANSNRDAASEYEVLEIQSFESDIEEGPAESGQVN